jgi:hypothetical protein
MKHFRKTAIAWRILAVLLTLVLLLTAAPLSFAAPAAENDAEIITEKDLEPGLPAVVYAKNVPAGMESTPFWDKFSFLQYKYYPPDKLVYNQNNAFQWVFGYNAVFDFFMWAANVYADCIRCKFTYQGKDWLVQIWKGAYAFILCTGGEIGVYNKPVTRKIGQYSAAREGDFLGIEMDIYRGDDFLFRRPFNYTWWCTGFQLGHLYGFWKKPRISVTMVARIKLKDAKMAKLCGESLAEKGFMPTSGKPSLTNTDSYAVSGDTLRLSWQKLTESFW